MGITAAVWYVAFQARFLIMGPEILISEELETIQDGRVMKLTGRAENVTAVFLNGRPIAIDQAGTFAEGVVLENGYTIVSIDARDRYGRAVHWERPFVYTEPTEQASEQSPANNL